VDIDINARFYMMLVCLKNRLNILLFKKLFMNMVVCLREFKGRMEKGFF